MASKREKQKADVNLLKGIERLLEILSFLLEILSYSFHILSEFLIFLILFGRRRVSRVDPSCFDGATLAPRLLDLSLRR